MYVKQFEKLPPAFQKSEIKPYFDYLQTRKGSLFVKRVLDVMKYDTPYTRAALMKKLDLGPRKVSTGIICIRQSKWT